MDAMVRLRHHSTVTARAGRRMRRSIRWTSLLGMLLVAGNAMAQRVEGQRAGASGPFDAEVPVNSQNTAERDSAFARALVQVLNNLSGGQGVAAQPGVSAELKRAEDYVDGYEYRQDEGVSATTGAPTFGTTLVVHFDPAKVQEMAGDLGLPVWPEPRPKPVLWLAIDDGSGPRLVGLAQANAARSILDRAKARGYKLGLPAGNAAEQAAAGAIWRGDTAAIARISSRYSPPMQLIGKLSRKGAGWHADWTLVDNGRVLSRWSDDDGDARRAMASGADGAADALVKRYAKRSGPGVGSPGSYTVSFAGIDGTDDYIRLSALLQKVSVVRAFRPVHAMPGTLDVQLDLTTGIAGFRRLAGDALEPAADTADGAPPVFRLR
jgi:hypothetical protein